MSLNSDNPGESSSGMSKVYTWVALAFYLFCFLFLVYGGPVIRNDTKTYLSMDAFRDPVYPLFLKFCRLFGSNFGLKIAVVIQLLFGAFSIYSLLKYIKSKFNIQPFVVFILSLVLMFPYFHVPMFNSGSASIGNYLMTEALAYPLFLIIIRYFIETIFDKNGKKAIIVISLTALLMLVRGQFKFMYVVDFAMIAYLLYANRNTKKALILCGLVIGCSVITNLFDRTYHLALHGKFVTTPFGGNQLFTPVLFFAKPGDENLFKDSTDKNIVRGMIQRVQEYRANNDDKNHQDDLYHIKKDYNFISWEACCHPLMDMYKDKTDMEKWDIVNKKAFTISSTLGHKYRNALILLYVENVKEQLGQITNWFFILMFSFVSLFYFLRKPLNSIFALVIFTLMIIWGNVLLVCLLETSEFRYNIYCLSLCTTVLIILLSTLFDRVYNNTTPISTSNDN